VDPDSVVFNFECCSGCDDKGFELIMDCLEKTPGLCQELDICLPVDEVLELLILLTIQVTKLSKSIAFNLCIK
jgi:hypothetical protein